MAFDSLYSNYLKECFLFFNVYFFLSHICHCNKNQNENANTKKKSEYMDKNTTKDTNDEAVVILDSHNCCSNKSNTNAQNKSITLKSYR